MSYDHRTMPIPLFATTFTAPTWTTAARTYRIMPNPLCFEYRTASGWAPHCPNPTEDSWADAELAVQNADWNGFLSFTEPWVRDLASQFEAHRLAALAVAASCPELGRALCGIPSLTVLVAIHGSLRGESRPHWEEIDAIYERNGIYGVMEWLGLPASRSALAAFRLIEDPALPLSLANRLRENLWNAAASPNLGFLGQSHRKQAA